jgi:signal transduction histidine kinase
VSSISHRLHSSKLELFGLASAAGTFCRETSSHYGIAVDFVHAGVDSKLPPGVAINLFRVLQEALSNAARHSGATRCDVSLRQADDELRLEVRDDGIGFDTVAALATSGLGLVSMQERLKLVDGSVTIESRPGAGTVIRATVPLGPARAESPDAATHVYEA